MGLKKTGYLISEIARLLFIFNVFHNIADGAMEDFTKQFYCMGANTFIAF